MRAILICLLWVDCLACWLFIQEQRKIEGAKWTSRATIAVRGESRLAGFVRLEFAKDGSLVYQAGSMKLRVEYWLGKATSSRGGLTKSSETKSVEFMRSRLRLMGIR